MTRKAQGLKRWQMMVLGLLWLGLLAGPAKAHSMSHDRQPMFQKIDQSVPVKLTVTLLGLGLLGGELWWFLGVRKRSP